MATGLLDSDRAAPRTYGAVSTWLGLAGWLALAYAALAVGAVFRADAWYAALAKPAWTPPGWVFPPVWVLLYTLMGVAAWLVWRRAGCGVGGPALGLFIAQLAVNAAWSPLFFGMHRPGLALLDIVAQDVLIASTIMAFRHHSRSAAGLLVPYWLWVTFATAVNFGVWHLNR